MIGSSGKLPVLRLEGPLVQISGRLVGLAAATTLALAVPLALVYNAGAATESLLSAG